MNEKQIAANKIKAYNTYIKALQAEKKSLEELLKLPTISLSEYHKAKAHQRIFDIEVTIQGHQAFIIEYQARQNPTTYRNKDF
jgi:hypothetical protein